MKKINKKGFTLIELLAVIVILAVVMVVTIPSVLNAMSGAKISQLNNATEAVSQWLTKKYEMANLDYELSSQEDVVYNNFESKMGTFPSSYSDAGYTGKDLNSCGNSNSTYCRAESIAMLEAAGISDPENNIDLTRSYIWLSNNKFGVKLEALPQGNFYTSEENTSSYSSTGSRLPDGYREVKDLVGNNSGHVIVDDLFLTGADTVRVKFQLTSLDINSFLVGFYDNTDANDNYSLYFSNNGKFYSRYGNTLNSVNLSDNTGNKEIVTSSTGLTINNSKVKTWNESEFTCNKAMCIGCSQKQSGTDGIRDNRVTGRIYEVKVDGRFDGIPAVRISDNKPGFYDLVTNKFYAATGTLTPEL